MEIKVNRIFACLLLAFPFVAGCAAETAVDGDEGVELSEKGLTPNGGPTVDKWDQYVPYHSQIGAQLWAFDKSTMSFVSAASQWASAPTSPSGGDVAWGDPANWKGPKAIEEWETRTNCSGGHSMVFVNAYRDSETGARYPIRTIKAVYVDLSSFEAPGGVAFDITTGCNPQDGQPHGQPYAVYNVYGAVYAIKVWGEIWTDGHADRRFYWEHQVTPYVPVTNPCWEGDGSETRTAIRQEEAWWDQVPGAIPGEVQPSEGTWSRGGGGAPFTDKGTPVDPNPWYGHRNDFGKDAGAGWTVAELDQVGQETWFGCMRWRWSW